MTKSSQIVMSLIKLKGFSLHVRSSELCDVPQTKLQSEIDKSEALREYFKIARLEWSTKASSDEEESPLEVLVSIDVSEDLTSYAHADSILETLRSEFMKPELLTKGFTIANLSWVLQAPLKQTAPSPFKVKIRLNVSQELASKIPADKILEIALSEIEKSEALRKDFEIANLFWISKSAPQKELSSGELRMNTLGIAETFKDNDNLPVK